MLDEYIIGRGECSNELKLVRKKIVTNRMMAIVYSLIWALFIIFSINYGMTTLFPSVMTTESPTGTIFKIATILSQVILVFLGGYIIYQKIYPAHWLSNMHIFFPRLVASIAAAWLTLAIGNELFGTFFDSIVSWSTSLWLTIIVFVFVMYEINILLPHEGVFNKVKRCLEIITISSLISLFVGLFIINFAGERFLERSGALENFYQEVVDKQVGKTTESKHYFIKTEKDKIIAKNASNHERLEGLEYIHIVPDTNKRAKDDVIHPIVTVWPLQNNSKFFILRDFLIQFAFVAMFIGIFIHMLFEDKSITET